MNMRALVRRIYFGSGLVLGLQLLLWLLSGVVMSWLPVALADGEANAFSAPPIALEAQTYASPGGVIAQANGATSLELRRFLGKPAYVVRGPVGATGIYDASSGKRLTPLTEALAKKVATQDYLGEGVIERATLISFPPREFSGPRPVWRIDYNDRFHTRLYISPNTGAVLARRNDIWRIHNMFRMLHIMDYDERRSAHNPLLMGVSAAGLVFALSGFVLAFWRLRRGHRQGGAPSVAPARMAGDSGEQD